jgi:integrase
MSKIRLTKATVDRLPYASQGQRLYFDEKLPGFGLLVGKRTKTYIAQRPVKGKTVRVTVGRHGHIWTEEARAEANILLGRMAKGENPNAEKRGSGITLRQAQELYLAGKPRAQRTVRDYRDSVQRFLGDWLDRPLVEITRKMTHDRHRRIGEDAGPYAANRTMAVFRATWNRAMRQQPELPVCPTINFDWYPEKARDAALSIEALPDWYAKVQGLSPVMRDYYLTLLFTGLRRTEAATRRWEDVDLEHAQVRIPNPKGGEDRSFTLPLSDFLIEVLHRRREENEILYPDCPWVFPAQLRKSREIGHLREPRKRGLPFPHALRHTYVSVATNHVELHPYTVKLLANHALPRGDVTAGYVTPDLDALRVAQQRVTDFLRSSLDPS